ncbi:MAG: [protein-PII] uridylyltransferase, partial [Steroidobacteraceae bacterium]
ARTTAVLDQLGLNILDARIVPTANGYSIETYVVLEGGGGAIVDAERIREIENALRHNLDQPDGAELTVTRRAPRQVRLFATATQVNLSHDARNDRTIVEIITGDRPGLLSVIGRIFMHDRVDIHGARIVTVGERAEDVFYVTGEDGAPLAEAAGQQLAARIVESLDRRG